MPTVQRVSNLRHMSKSIATTQRIQETTTGYSRIDRDAGVIVGVKVLGLKSANNGGKRRYLQEAADRAIPRYEGSKVFIDHILLDNKQASNSKIRKTGERWGLLKNVAPDGDGLSGDLHYLKSHPLTEQILEAIDRFGDAGLSHDVGGKVRKEGNEEIVYDIAEVYSVDFVQQPATNRNLFEERQTMQKKLLATLREHVKLPVASLLLANLVEMGDMYGEDTAMLPPADGMTDAAGDPEQDIADAFRTAIMAVLDSTDDTATKMSKIKMILGVQDKLDGAGAGGTGAGTETETETDETMTEEVTKLKTELAQLREENRLAKARVECTNLLEEVGCEVTEVRIKALSQMQVVEDRKALAESFAKKGRKPAASPGRFQEQASQASSDLPKAGDIDGVKKLLRLSR